MPRYSARCVTAAGQGFSLEMEAPSIDALRQFVERRQGFLVSQREIPPRLAGRRTRIPAEALAQLFNLLALQLACGVHTDQAIAKLRAEFPDRRVRLVLEGVHSQLSSARAALSAALALFPRSFPEGTIAAVRVGEQSGATGLAERFADLRDQIRFRLKIRQAAVRAVAYPAFILSFAAGVVGLVRSGDARALPRGRVVGRVLRRHLPRRLRLLLLVVVVGLLLVKLVPLVEELLTSLHVPLPPVTRGILTVSAFARQHGVSLLAGTLLALAAAHLLRSWPPSALALDRLLLRLPVAGSIFRALVTAEIAKTYRALYSAGASATDSLAACAAVVPNRALRVALLRARRALETGELTADKPDHPAITEALRSTGYLPELALTIIGTGEVSGGLARALDHVAEHYAQSAQEQIAVFFALFDKLLMLVLIFTVGLVILGIWQPIMTAAQNIH